MKNAKSRKGTWIPLILVAVLIIQYNLSFSQEFEMPGYISDLSACDFDINGAQDILVVCNDQH
jgi:hypothetical protein